MRIIAGQAKGLPLQAPKGNHTRPTTDRVKEAIFSTIQGLLNGANILDLFAGSGALGMEAISRGAQQVVFVDNWQRAVECLSRNLERARMSRQAQVVKGDVLHYLENYRGLPFDLIFLDPPYDSNLGQQALVLIAEKGLLVQEGYIIWEISAKTETADFINNLEIVKEKKYGDTKVVYLKNFKKEEAYGRF